MNRLNFLKRSSLGALALFIPTPRVEEEELEFNEENLLATGWERYEPPIPRETAKCEHHFRKGNLFIIYTVIQGSAQERWKSLNMEFLDLPTSMPDYWGGGAKIHYLYHPDEKIPLSVVDIKKIMKTSRE